MKQNKPVPKSTAGTVPGGQTTWYKSDVAYDMKQTGLAAIPLENLLNVTRKQKAGCQPKLPLEDPQSTKEKELHQLNCYHRCNPEPLT